jgi:hypothetical protein
MTIKQVYRGESEDGPSLVPHPSSFRFADITQDLGTSRRLRFPVRDDEELPDTHLIAAARVQECYTLKGTGGRTLEGPPREPVVRLTTLAQESPHPRDTD